MNKAEFIKWLSIRTGYVFSDDTNQNIGEKLDKYAQQVSREKCNDCVHTFQKRGTQGYHDVEEFYKED